MTATYDPGHGGILVRPSTARYRRVLATRLKQWGWIVALLLGIYELVWVLNGLWWLAIISPLVLALLWLPRILLRFSLQRFIASSGDLRFRGSFGRTRRWQAHELARIAIGKVDSGIGYATPRILVFTNYGHCCLKVPGDLWEPEDVAQVARALNLPLDGNPEVVLSVAQQGDAALGAKKVKRRRT